MKSRPIFSLMVALGFSLFGFILRSDISLVRVDQRIYPGIAIRIEANGYDVNKVESDITTPIEKAIATVGGVRSMRSISEDGSVLIQIKMEDSAKLKEKSLEFREKIDLVATRFPREVHKPQVFRYDPTNSPLMVVSFSKKNMNQDELRELIEKSLKRSLEGVEGVSQVIVAGGKIREIQVACDARQLEAYRLSLRDIVTAFQDRNQNDSLGKLSNLKDSLGLQMKERFENLLEIGDMPVRVTGEGQVISIKDIANVSLSRREENIGARLNAEEKVTAFVYKNESSDGVSVSEGVRLVIEKKNLADIKVEYNQDESRILTETIKSLLFLEALVILSLFFFYLAKKKFIDFFLIFIICLIPSFFGFLLIFGIFASHLSLASCYGNVLGNLFWAVTRIRNFTIDKNGKLIQKKELPLGFLFLNVVASIIFSLFLSQVVSHFYLTLVLSCGLFFILLDFYFIILATNILNSFSWSVFEISNSRWIKYYEKASDFLINKSISYRSKTEEPILSDKIVLPLSLSFFVLLGIYAFFKIDLKDSVESDRRDTVAFLEFPSGTSFSHTDEVSLKVEKSMLGIPGVKQVVSKVDPAHTLLLIELEKGFVPDAEFLKILKAGVGPTEDGFLFFASDQDSSFFQEITFDMIGYDQKLLETYVQDLAEKVKALDGVAEVILRYKPSREELQLRPDPTLFMVSEISLPHFGNELNLALQGGVATKFIDGEKEVDIRIRFAEKYRSSRFEFNEMRIKSLKDKFLPIATVVKAEEAKVPVKIYHKNRSRTLSFAVKLEGSSNRTARNVTDYVKSYPLPTGYRVEEDNDYMNNNLISSNVGKLFFFFLPVLVFLVSLFSNRKMILVSEFLLTYLIPYVFSIFLIQFFYPGAFYLPFQISLLLAVPFAFYFVRIKYHLTKGILLYLGFLYVLLLIFANSSVISFLYILFGIVSYLYLVSFGIRLQREWEKKYEMPLWKFGKQSADDLRTKSFSVWKHLRSFLFKQEKE
ncbi:efflux RND transporter permease subunit [Leptospira meyeri]|uniref:efflux RND transporter permease subunit n=1 Tax=Leptospira meyeri TaxID=29508 RepID=UPI000F6453CA|nr:efflux RND transporter permease subunit [Leptospira meyeri]